MAAFTNLSNSFRACPGSFDCREGLTSFDIGRVPTYFSIVSCSLSCLGSILIVSVYFGLKGIRNGTQKIITLLAIADFFTAAGYLIAAGNFLKHYEETDPKKCDTFDTICQIQSYITTWSSLCSFCWTVALAVHFFLINTPNKRQFAAKLLPFENVVAWCVPIIIVLPLLATGRLGFTPYAASNWCYIRDNNYRKDIRDSDLNIALFFVAGKFWEICSYLIVIVLYAATKRRFHKQKRYLRIEQHSAVEQVEQRLLLIPLVFLFLRIWGTVQFFFSLAVSGENQNGCIPKNIQKTFYVFGILQAIGDGGQGWGNAILYIFLSPPLRSRVVTAPLHALFHWLWQSIGEKMMINNTENETKSDSSNRRETSLEQQPPNSAPAADRRQTRAPLAGTGNRVTCSELDGAMASGVPVTMAPSDSSELV